MENTSTPTEVVRSSTEKPPSREIEASNFRLSPRHLAMLDRIAGELAQHPDLVPQREGTVTNRRHAVGPKGPRAIGRSDAVRYAIETTFRKMRLSLDVSPPAA